MAEQMIYCPHCQGQLSFDNRYSGIELQCPLCQQKFVCGTNPLPIQPPPPPAPGVYNNPCGNPAVPSPQQTGKNNPKVWIIAGACIAFLIVLGFILPFAISNYNERKELKTAKEQGITFSKDNKTLDSCSNKEISSVTIPSCVTKIDNWAFSGCVNLTSVTIPDSVTSIGEWAFYGCVNLTSVTIPDSVTSIGDRAFLTLFGGGLTSVSIPRNCTVGEDAFPKNCKVTRR